MLLRRKTAAQEDAFSCFYRQDPFHRRGGDRGCNFSAVNCALPLPPSYRDSQHDKQQAPLYIPEALEETWASFNESSDRFLNGSTLKMVRGKRTHKD